MRQGRALLSIGRLRRTAPRGALGAVLLGLLLGSPLAASADEPAAPVPPDARPPAPPPPSAGSLTEALPDVVVDVPRAYAGPFAAGGEQIQTPLRHASPTFDVPYATSVQSADDLRQRRNVRSLPDALLRLPSTVVQKTGPGQSSPFLRGFTGYHNLLLIDGVRLNNSAFRSGPNQYWSTVDPYTVERLEVTRGPHSVLWGSDAVGGTVNVIPRRRTCFPCGRNVGGGLFARWASAEHAWTTRGEVEGNWDRVGFLGGFTWKDFGTITSGDGDLPNTGYREWDGDVRADWRVSACSTLTVAFQHVEQDDVPRTHSTIYAVPFAGTTVGTDLERDLDQQRDLVYARWAWDKAGGFFPTGHVTLSWQRQAEDQRRVRTGGRMDLSGFDVETWGLALQLARPTAIGRLTVGADATHDEVNSFKDNFQNGAYQSSDVQGPLGDEGAYDLAGAYAQVEVERGCLTLVPGVRFSYARAQADRVDNPLVAGANPATPNNVIGIDEDYDALVGSLRALLKVRRGWNVYGGVSQAFRAPSLSDLTAFDSTSVVESPAPGLDPDRYLGFELGTKVERGDLAASLAGWYVLLNDTIVRSPTGALIGGVPEVRKDNVGDGFVWGVELEAAWRFLPAWTVLGQASYMAGEVDQLNAAQQIVRDDLDRLMPLTTLLALRYEPPCGRLWAQVEWVHAEKADRLSLQNETDRERIPPGGTPGYDVFHLRSGYRWSKDLDLLFTLENLTDANYRIHGSGVNEPGLNAVLGFDLRF